MDDGQLNFFEAYDIINKVAKSEKPNIEKIPLLIKVANDFYAHLDLGEEKTSVVAWKFNSEKQEWEKEKMTAEEAVDQASSAFGKYQEQKALDNMSEAYSYYSKRYKKITSVYKPFFDYCFQLLEEVRASMVVALSGKKTTLDIKELRQTVSTQEQTISLLKDSLDLKSESLDDATTKLKEQSKIVGGYSDWLKLLTSRTSFSKDAHVRIVLFLLTRGEGQSAEMSAVLNIARTSLNPELSELAQRGVLRSRPMGKSKIYSLDHDYPSKIIQPLPEKDKNISNRLVEFNKNKEIETGE